MSETALKANWDDALSSALDLANEGFIRPDEVSLYEPLLSQFRFHLPRYYANLIDKTDPNCPIRKQAIPSLEELQHHQGFLADPLSDLKHQPVKKITHRYPNRALIHLTSNCSMYCRYCFRKTLLNEKKDELFWGEDEALLKYLEEHREIEEVIFSGGDPFMLPAVRLAQVLERVQKISTIKRVRFHTRVPVTFPSRITENFAAILAGVSLPTVVVVHFNHPKEITTEAKTALGLLKAAGAVLLNQSVLLRGVNDSAEILKSLSEDLFNAGVLPYYLHHPDRAEGTAHFDLSKEEGLAIYDELRASLSGYLVPRYVIDIVGHPYKAFVSEGSNPFRAQKGGEHSPNPLQS